MKKDQNSGEPHSWILLGASSSFGFLWHVDGPEVCGLVLYVEGLLFGLCVCFGCCLSVEKGVGWVVVGAIYYGFL